MQLTKLSLSLPLILALACGGGSAATGETTPEPVAPTELAPAAPLGPEQFYPATTFAVLDIDVRRGLSSPYYQVIRDVWDDYTRSPSARTDAEDLENAEHVLSVLQRIESLQVVFALDPQGSPDLALFVARGDLPPEFVLSEIDGFGRGTTEPAELASLPNGLTMIRKGEGRLIFLGDGTVVLGPENEDFGSLEARVQQPGMAPTLLSEARWTEPAAQLGIAEPIVDLRLVVTSPALARELDDGPFDGIASHILSIHLAADATEGVQVASMVKTDDAAAAQQIINGINEGLAEASGNPMAAMMGLSAPAQYVQVSLVGSDVQAQLDIPHQTIMQMVTMVQGLLSFAQAQNQGAASAPAPTTAP